MKPFPQAGDIIIINFNPQSGKEIQKKRPALVVSNDSFNRLTGLVMVCPITSTHRNIPIHGLGNSRIEPAHFPDKFLIIAAAAQSSIRNAAPAAHQAGLIQASIGPGSIGYSIANAHRSPLTILCTIGKLQALSGYTCLQHLFHILRLNSKGQVLQLPDHKLFLHITNGGGIIKIQNRIGAAVFLITRRIFSIPLTKLLKRGANLGCPLLAPLRMYRRLLHCSLRCGCACCRLPANQQSRCQTKAAQCRFDNLFPWAA